MWASILAENLCKGIGKLGELVFGPLYREKGYRDALRRAQAEKDAKSIAAGENTFDGSKLIPTIPMPNLNLESLPLMIALEEESNNLNSTIDIAANILKDIPDNQISDEKIDEDWFYKWRKEAQLINNIEMRNIWARILAEEIKSPESISLITLDRLRNTTAKHANIFCKVARYRINKIIPIADPFYRIYNIDELLILQNIGLIDLDSALFPKSYVIEDLEYSAFICNGFALAINCNQQIDASGINGAVITETGDEILKVADNISEPTIDEINEIGEYVWHKLPKDISFTKMIAYSILKNGTQILFDKPAGPTWIRE